MPDITLTLNQPISEKVHSAWSVFHTAHGLAFSHLEGSTFYDGGSKDSVFQEPNTGIITLNPTFFDAKRLDPLHLRAWYLPEDLEYAGTVAGGALFAYAGSTRGNPVTDAAYQIISPKLVNVLDARVALAVDGNKENFILRPKYSDQNFVWSMKTKVALETNQGFALVVSPEGIFADFADSWFLIAFGGKFILELSMAGFANLHGDVDGTGNYVHIDTYHLKNGGVNFGQAFQVSVIPLGKRFLSVSFTQNPRPAASNRASSFSSESEYFLTILRGQNSDGETPVSNLEPIWSPSLNQWVKYPKDFITLGLCAKDFDYHIAIAKAYYPSTQSVSLAWEFPPERVTWAPITPNKVTFEGHIEAGGGSATSIAPVLVNVDDAIYDPTTGRAIISKLLFSPSQNGVYTPELHAFGLSYPAHVQTSAFTPIDVSPNWQLIRFMRTCDLNAQRVELKLLRDDDWQTFMRTFGSCRLKANDNDGNPVILVDFYAQRMQPTFTGPSQLANDQFEGLDIWDRLNNQPLQIDSIVEGDEVAVQFQNAILKAGFQSSEVFIDYGASPELSSLTFGKFTNPNDLLRPNSDTSAGDFIRNTAEKLGVQFSPPIRVRWMSNGSGGMRWRIYLGPIYGSSTALTHGKVHHRFFLDDGLLPDDYDTQDARYSGHDFVVLSAPEFTVLRPEFNAILASAAKGVDGKEGAEPAYIPCPARVISDPTYVGYEGCERVKQLATESLQIAQTTESVAQVARTYYENHYNLKRLRLLEFSGEWQPEIDADEFVAVIGAAKFDDPDGRFSQGDPVCYGAYRIEHIDIEIRHDYDDDDTSTNLVRYEWTGSYTLVYVGPYEDPDFPRGPLVMWTEAANLPDDYDLPEGFTA